jgi:hypothetical protein
MLRERPMAAKLTSTAEVRAPGREIRFGGRTSPQRARTRPRAGIGDTASRPSPAAYRATRRCEIPCKRNSSHHTPDAGRFDRPGRWSMPRGPNRLKLHEVGRRSRCWLPTSLRWVRISAPPGQSGRSEEISATAGASADPPFPALPSNHTESRKSRSGSQRHA